MFREAPDQVKVALALGRWTASLAHPAGRHRLAAGASFTGSLESVIALVLDRVKDVC